MKLVIGTRGSTLARAQTGTVAERLRVRGHEVEVRLVETRGDRERGRPVVELGGKGLFTAELERALRDRRIDVAVHSFKDLPAEEERPLRVAAVLERADPRDALVAREGSGLDDLPRGAKVGTASPRRRALLLSRRPDLDVVPLRGNVDTRLGKVESGELDAVVVAAAGLLRMERADAITARLDFLPAPAQGALAVQAHSAHREILAALAALHHEPTARCVRAERVLLHSLEGGCSVPVGALGEQEAGGLRLRGCVASLDGKRVLEAEGAGRDPDALGLEVARRLRDQGAGEILRG